MTTIDLEELFAYTRCPLEGWWRERAGQAAPLTPERMLRQALADALRFVCEGHTASLAEAIDWVWSDWAETWARGDALLQDLRAYAGSRNAVLEQLERQRGRGPGLAQRLHALGLTGLARRLDRQAAEQGVTLVPGRAGPGSRFGDAYADSLRLAARAKSFETPLRLDGASQAVRGEVSLGAIMVRGEVDLVTADGVAEVHDVVTRAPQRRREAKHDWRVIFAAHAALPDHAPLEGRERTVVVRQWLSGVSYVFTETNLGYLQTGLAALWRARVAQVGVPRAVADPEACLRCEWLATCQPDGWPDQHLLDPGLVARTDRLQRARRALRAALEARPELRAVAGEALTAVAAGWFGDDMEWPGDVTALVDEQPDRRAA